MASLCCVQVRTKTFVAVGHESANNTKLAANDHMHANLLANMEMGMHQPGAGPRGTSEDGIQMNPISRSDDADYRATGDSDDAYYSRGPLQVGD